MSFEESSAYIYLEYVIMFYCCFFSFPQTSLMRQECLEHDQRIVALVSMVRHIEVRLKQQQQQSVGRSLIALEDIIRQTEVKEYAYLPDRDLLLY